MVCIVCYDSLFGPGRRSTTSHRLTSAAQSRRQPAALNCGHAFHKGCIDRWFSTSETRACPLCHKAHQGPALVLYIDADESEGNNSQSQSATSGSSLNTASQPLDIDRLCECFEELGVEMPDQDDYTSYGDYCGELLDGLVASTGELVSRHESERERMQSRINKLVDDLEASNSLCRAKEFEIAGMDRLSDAHRTHIASLQNALERKKWIINAYEDRYGVRFYCRN
ncbi:hypothetical protein GGI23_000108 [Coemansia sp. RSA 2559]|nr:hypothetical protein GGI23_000108 [Coemansia sp. RSA 2559]KAJ2869498.1 hypothetical protein GGI22_000215 [Coemansia erecta]